MGKKWASLKHVFGTFLAITFGPLLTVEPLSRRPGPRLPISRLVTLCLMGRICSSQQNSIRSPSHSALFSHPFCPHCICFLTSFGSFLSKRHSWRIFFWHEGWWWNALGQPLGQMPIGTRGREEEWQREILVSLAKDHPQLCFFY